MKERRGKKIQNCICADSMFLGGTVFWWLRADSVDSAFKGTCCRHSCNFDCFAMSSTPQGVYTHYQVVTAKETIDKLEVSISFLLEFIVIN